MTDFFAALALVFVIEGLLYAAFPEQMKRALLQILEAPVSFVRMAALTSAGIGLILLWLIRG